MYQHLFICHLLCQTDFQHPLPRPHFKCFQQLLFCFSQRPGLCCIQCYIPNLLLIICFRHSITYQWWNCCAMSNVPLLSMVMVRAAAEGDCERSFTSGVAVPSVGLHPAVWRRCSPEPSCPPIGRLWRVRSANRRSALQMRVGCCREKYQTSYIVLWHFSMNWCTLQSSTVQFEIVFVKCCLWHSYIV